MTEAQLRDRIEVLEEENRQLREQLVPAIALPKAWGMTGMEARLLLAIRAVSPNLLTRHRAMLALYGFEDGPTGNSLECFLTHARQKLTAAGVAVTIENHRARGWRMTHESARAFDDALAWREAA